MSKNSVVNIQSLSILDFLPGYGWDHARPDLSLQRGQLSASPCTSQTEYPMMLLLCQGELLDLTYTVLLCHESTMSWLTVEHPEVRGFFVRIGRQNPLGRIPVDQSPDHRGDCQQGHPDIRRQKRFQPERWSCGEVWHPTSVVDTWGNWGTW